MIMRTYHPVYTSTRRIVIPPEAWQLAKYPYTIAHSYDNENGYVGRVIEMPEVVIAEDTLEALEASLYKAIALAIAVDLRNGRPIRTPQGIAV